MFVSEIALAEGQACKAKLDWFDSSYQHGEKTHVGHDFYGSIPAARFQLVESDGCPSRTVTVVFKGLQELDLSTLSTKDAVGRDYEVGFPVEFLEGNYLSIDGGDVQIKDFSP